jgi:pimeloyl-ACP methyl ester carboxylesterase
MSPLAPTVSAPAENSTTVRVKTRDAVEPEVPSGIRAARAALRVASRVSPDLAAALAMRFFASPRRRPRPAREHEALERARHFLIPFPSTGALRAWEWGEAGPRVLVVHGWEGRAAQLAPFAERLAELGFRVVGFDAPAHGDTPGATCTFFDFADAITAAADALGPLHAVVTHSMGGAATAWAARHRPLAKRYAMIAPPADVRDFSRGFARIMQISDDVRERMERRIARRFDVDLAEVRTDRSVRDQRAPLLVVHDVADREVPFDKGRIIADAWPGAVLVRTDGLGHQRILRDPDVVRRIERFVAWGATA